jgi:hypothetical protein
MRVGYSDVLAWCAVWDTTMGAASEFSAKNPALMVQSCGHPANVTRTAANQRYETESEGAGSTCSETPKPRSTTVINAAKDSGSPRSYRIVIEGVDEDRLRSPSLELPKSPHGYAVTRP